MQRYFRISMIAFAAGLAAAGAPRARAETAETTLAAWLVEQGRAYAISPVSQGRTADVGIVLAYMQAAERIDPGCAEALLWQVELYRLAGLPESAHDALGQYLKAEPSDISAWVQWMDGELARRQTAEERLAVCDELAARDDAPQMVRSDVERRRAEILLAQGRRDEARRAADEALHLFPLHRIALRLRQRLEGNVSPREQHLLELIDAVAFNPARLDGILELAGALDCAGLRGEAREWYGHALRCLRHRGAPAADRIAVRQRMAASALADRAWADAMRYAREVVEADEDAVRARILLLRAAEGAGDSAAAAGQRDWLAAHYAADPPAAEGPAAALHDAQRAWYFARVVHEPARAVECAERALAAAPDHPVVRSCAGFAYLENGEAQRAVELLERAAGVDPLAAVGLAAALRRLDRADEARETLRRVIDDCASGDAFEAAAVLWLEENDTPPVAELPLVRQALADFNRASLEWAISPEKSARFDVELVRPVEDVTSPWVVRLVLENVGDFPLTVGAGRMIEPDVVMTFNLTGRVNARFTEYFRTSLNMRPILLPGERVEKTCVVDPGPLRHFLYRTAQAGYNVRVDVVLGPTATSEGTVSAHGGWGRRELTFARPGLRVDNDWFGTTARVSQAGRAEQRLKASLILAALLAERQAAESTPVDYGAYRVDEMTLSRLLLSRTTDEDRNVRLRVLGTLSRVKLEKSFVFWAGRSLNHEDWLTRFMTVRVIAEQVGATYLPLILQVAEQDKDDSVRELASALASRISFDNPKALEKK